MQLKLLTVLGSFGGGGGGVDPTPYIEEIARLEQEIEAARVQIDLLGQELAERVQELQDAEQEISTLQGQITGLQARVEYWSEQCRGLETQLAACQQEVARLTQELVGKDAVIDELTQDLAQAQEDVAELSAQVAAMQETIDNQAAIIAEQAERIAELEKQAGGSKIDDNGNYIGKIIQNSLARTVGTDADASNVVNGNNLFQTSTMLETVDCDWPAMTSAQNMCQAAPWLRTWRGDTPVLSVANGMFQNCNMLDSFTGDLSRLTNSTYMFNGCSKLTSFNVDLPALTTAGGMFYGCSKLSTFTSDLPALDAGNQMFKNCSQLTEFSTDLHLMTNGGGMFAGCSKLSTFTSDLSSMTDAQYFFQNCSSLTSIDATFPRAANTASMFCGCSSLTSIVMDFPLTTNVPSMFNGCTSLREYRGSLDVMTNGQSMFQNCTSLITVDMQMPLMTNAANMFQGCRLSAASVKRIVDNIKDCAGVGGTHNIQIGVNELSVTQEQQNDYDAQLRAKNWNVTWQRNPAPDWWDPSQDEPIEGEPIQDNDIPEGAVLAYNEDDGHPVIDGQQLYGMMFNDLYNPDVTLVAKASGTYDVISYRPSTTEPNNAVQTAVIGQIIDPLITITSEQVEEYPNFVVRWHGSVVDGTDIMQYGAGIENGDYYSSTSSVHRWTDTTQYPHGDAWQSLMQQRAELAVTEDIEVMPNGGYAYATPQGVTITRLRTDKPIGNGEYEIEEINADNLYLVYNPDKTVIDVDVSSYGKLTEVTSLHDTLTEMKANGGKVIVRAAATYPMTTYRDQGEPFGVMPQDNIGYIRKPLIEITYDAENDRFVAHSHACLPENYYDIYQVQTDWDAAIATGDPLWMQSPRWWASLSGEMPRNDSLCLYVQGDDGNFTYIEISAILHNCSYLDEFEGVVWQFDGLYYVSDEHGSGGDFPDTWNVQDFGNQELLKQLYNQGTGTDAPAVMVSTNNNYAAGAMLISGERLISAGVSEVAGQLSGDSLTIDADKNYAVLMWHTPNGTASHNINDMFTSQRGNLNKICEITGAAATEDQVDFEVNNVLRCSSSAPKVVPIFGSNAADTKHLTLSINANGTPNWMLTDTGTTSTTWMVVQ